MPKTPAPNKARVQLDISERAKTNLKLYAALRERSMSEVLDEILVQHLQGVALQTLGESRAWLFEERV